MNHCEIITERMNQRSKQTSKLFVAEKKGQGKKILRKISFDIIKHSAFRTPHLCFI